MPSNTITFHLDAPPERVFDYIADIRNEVEWSKDITSVKLVGDGPIGEGTEFDTVYRGAFKALAPMLKVGMPREMAKRPGQFSAALSGR